MRRAVLTIAVLGMMLGSGAAVAEQKALSDADLLTLASNKYASGELPLGDGHYVLDGPKTGYIYLCRVPPKGGGAQFDGPWIHGDTWNILAKPSVNGTFYWSGAYFNNVIDGNQRVLSGNGLPVNYPTGLFPIQSSDPAAQYDHNPNSISAQTIHEALPLRPVYTSPPYCMGMEVGYMMNGVPLFAGFDAAMRDAEAHEVQDKCGGHPERTGQYHYHGLNLCLKDASVKTVIGFALDGYPITGPVVAPGKFLTTDDLDECHGLTSMIMLDGKTTITYHYVMTEDFPYSVSCFRSKPTRTGPQHAPSQQIQNMDMQQGQDEQGSPGSPPRPPEFAIAACNGRQNGDLCEFTSPRGDNISGTCHAPPMQQVLACMPARR